MKEITRDKNGITVEVGTVVTGHSHSRWNCGYRKAKERRVYRWEAVSEQYDVPVEKLRKMGLRAVCYIAHGGHKRTLGTALKYVRQYSTLNPNDF